MDVFIVPETFLVFMSPYLELSMKLTIKKDKLRAFLKLVLNQANLVKT